MPKLHIPSPGSFTATACGRQLNNHRAERVQDATRAVISTSLDEYLAALQAGKACRHCGRKARILPPLTRTVRQDVDVDGESEE